MLRDLALKSVYKSDQDNILEDFYIPALSTARRYDRAVGFFSASTLSYAAQALSAFVRNEGRIRLVLGAFADLRDLEAVRRGEQLREMSELIGAQLLGILEEASDALFQSRFEALAWLVARERMEIKVALRAHGMYHDKIGFIEDEAKDAVVFSGSANESLYALLPTHNYESIDVYPSWRPELADYFVPHKDSFERLWSNTSRGTVVVDVPTAVRDRLLEGAAKLDRVPDPEREATIARRLLDQATPEVRRSGPRTPDSINGAAFEIRPHQKAALAAWRDKGDWRGILDLATGAGKTVTAIYAVVQMAKGIPGLTAVIAAPYQNLADQWCDTLETFNIHPIRCYVSKGLWLSELKAAVHAVGMSAAPFTAIVVVNRTLKSPEFQASIARLPSDRFFWIGDECHHHASEAFTGFLPDNARYRMGLSATPEHYLDAERNQRLKAYYGEIVFTYTLKQAVHERILTPYDYYPHLVELTLSEADDFIALTNEIARQMARETGGRQLGPPGPGLTALLMRRARLIASASNKISALAETLQGEGRRPHSLFYCGDGQVEDEDGEDDTTFSRRQIEVVSRKLDQMRWRVSRFTSRESRHEREQILANFRVGLIDAMVAIRCLDEGIDVPACSIAYILASSRDPRQFIQRRGRILRRSPGKESATIHDYVVVLPEAAEDEQGHARKLISSELKRVAEFAGLARNGHAAYQTLRPVLQAYGLEHVL